MERDDLIVNDQYSMDAHHSEEAGTAIRKKIVKVTLILTLITFVEVVIGMKVGRSESGWWTLTKWFFIVLTLVKAGYIVAIFMHLGDERKNMRNLILYPYAVFIVYLIVIALMEGNWNAAMEGL